MLDKTYDASQSEQRIWRLWEEADAFAAGRPERRDAEPFSIVIPPPNVTGSLHMGHALNNTLQDVLARFERMRGRDVLWQPGMDHAGIATQMVVERQLAATGEPGRREMGREAFVERVWQWKAQSGGMILNQLRRLGASCDWSRERFTMDEGLSAAVAKIFVQLYEDGLIYRDKRLVNWDPKFQTAISDLEVEQKEVEGHMWRFAYPLADGPVDGMSEIIIATTRPETMLGDGAVAVHPSDERYKNLIGKLVRLPVADRLIPIIADEYPDPEFGSGAVKITGAHDFNDFEVARRNNVPLIVLMDEQARLVATPENKVPERYHGVDRYEARKMIVAEIEAEGLFRGVEEKLIAQPFGDRSGVVIEPMLMDQWYVNAATLAAPAMAAVREGRTRFVPASWEKTYFNWMENIQPWCISRQLWWGHQIPAWYGPRLNEDGSLSYDFSGNLDEKVFVAADEAGAVSQARDHYGREVQVAVDRFDAEALHATGPNDPVTLFRDEDVLDTWFSSGLWPFSTLGWPDEDAAAYKRFYPTDTLVTGFDIIFFWVARMMMMGLYATGEVPFRDVYIHALVRDERGQKMSKSKGNVIDPLELVDAYGADALRFTLAAMAAQGRDIKLATGRVEGYRNFTTKLWNAARFCEMNGCRRDAGFEPGQVRETINRWIVGETERAVAAVTSGLVEYRFNEAAGAAYQFVWSRFCDWYLELAKPILSGTDEAAKTETQATAAWALDAILKLLHPFMPFITEELWQHTAGWGAAREQVLTLAAWPEPQSLQNAQADAEIEWVIELVTAIRSVRSEMNVPPGAQIPLLLVAPDQDARARAERHEALLSRLARLSRIEEGEAVPSGAVQLVVGRTSAALPLADVIDIAAERARLEREIAKLQDEIGKVDKKLGNAQFLAKAPEEVVEEQRERRTEAEERQTRLRDALRRLQDAG
jgi:valyl-tRNA synthetase